eukprot:comp12878_c0_seq1/m.8063 comp12878_c0_seq1/g.8063  ORF comp12878_c0_seq1/g.8063 comp12878_c0_seq1/m.8063 type:complete len:329 (-) comp12878_c0_seq1:274-1260(-)
MSSKDRTAEFHAAAQSMRMRRGPVYMAPKRPRDEHLEKQRSDFKRLARALQTDIGSTSTKLEKLNLLVQKRALFEDRTAEIEDLTAIIRQDIGSLNQMIARLQKYQRATSQGSRQAEAHATNIVLALQSYLAGLSTSFKDALEYRTKALQEMAARQQQYSGPGYGAYGDTTQGAPSQYGQGYPQYPQQGPSGGGQRYGGYQQTELTQRHRVSSAGHAAIDMGGAQAQDMLYAEPTNAYNQERSKAMDQINKTIAELGGIFTQLAAMVHEQGQTIQRIDDLTADAEMNIEGAHTELLKYFSSVSSNRGLMIKIFAVLIIFFVLFVGFMN